MPTTRTFPKTDIDVLDFNEFNGTGATLSTFCEYINAYLAIAAGVNFSDLSLVGIGIPAGDAGSNFSPLYNFNYLTQSLPVFFRFRWGDQDWIQSPLASYNQIPASATINSVRFNGHITSLSDGTNATTWKLLLSADGITVIEIDPDNFGTPVSPSINPEEFFATTLTTNPITGNPWTRAEIFSYEWGIKIVSSDGAGVSGNFGPNCDYSSGGPSPCYYQWFTSGQEFNLLVDYNDVPSVTMEGDLFIEASVDGGLFAIESDLSIEATLAAELIISVDASGLYTLIPNQRHDTIYVDSGNGGDTIDVPIPKPFVKTAYIND